MKTAVLLRFAVVAATVTLLSATVIILSASVSSATTTVVPFPVSADKSISPLVVTPTTYSVTQSFVAEYSWTYALVA